MTRPRIAIAVVVLVFAAGYHVFGQSPAATTKRTFGGKTIEIRYAAPSVRGRQIFGAGGLLSKDPTYPVWRAGANAATTLAASGDLEIGALKVAAGTYTLFVLVKDPNAWELIVNRQIGQWGLDYDGSRDLGRVAMAMSKPAAPVEVLRYVITDSGGGKGQLRLEWENRVGSVPLVMR